ncbi:sulfurtransferase [Longispora urticae]
MSPLLKAAELAEYSPLTLLDVRWRLMGQPGRSDYLAGHLPGAVFVDLDTDLSGAPGAAGRHPLPTPSHLQEALRSAGVRQDRPVLVYDAGDGLAAGRAWWTLRWAGLTEVYVLDGGFAAWTGEVSTRIPTPERGDVVVTPGSMPTVDAAGALALAGKGRLFDVRAAERFRGEVEPIDKVAGHIPGARNRPIPDGPDYGPKDEPLALYCGSGVTAAQAALAATLAGYTPSVYVGSWSEWISDPDRPVALGE